MYPSGHANDGVHAIIFVLEDWFQAIENGSVQYRFPAHKYVKQWTEAQLEAFMSAIDQEIDMEVNRAPGTQTRVMAQAGSGFLRLAVPQRLALAQTLDMTIKEHAEALGLLPAYG